MGNDSEIPSGRSKSGRKPFYGANAYGSFPESDSEANSTENQVDEKMEELRRKATLEAERQAAEEKDQSKEKRDQLSEKIPVPGEILKKITTMFDEPAEALRKFVKDHMDLPREGKYWQTWGEDFKTTVGALDSKNKYPTRTYVRGLQDFLKFKAGQRDGRLGRITLGAMAEKLGMKDEAAKLGIKPEEAKEKKWTKEDKENQASYLSLFKKAEEGKTPEQIESWALGNLRIENKTVARDGKLSQIIGDLFGESQEEVGGKFYIRPGYAPKSFALLHYMSQKLGDLEPHSELIKTGDIVNLEKGILTVMRAGKEVWKVDLNPGAEVGTGEPAAKVGTAEKPAEAEITAQPVEGGQVEIADNNKFLVAMQENLFKGGNKLIENLRKIKDGQKKFIKLIRENQGNPFIETPLTPGAGRQRVGAIDIRAFSDFPNSWPSQLFYKYREAYKALGADNIETLSLLNQLERSIDPYFNKMWNNINGEIRSGVNIGVSTTENGKRIDWFAVHPYYSDKMRELLSIYELPQDLDPNYFMPDTILPSRNVASSQTFFRKKERERYKEEIVPAYLQNLEEVTKLFGTVFIESKNGHQMPTRTLNNIDYESLKPILRGNTDAEKRANYATLTARVGEGNELKANLNKIILFRNVYAVDWRYRKEMLKNYSDSIANAINVIDKELPLNNPKSSGENEPLAAK